MTDAEALMWSLDAVPILRSSFMSVTFLDGSPDFDRFRERVAEAAAITPMLTRRVSPAPFNMSAPLWTPDPGFDIDYHVRRIALPPPGAHEQVFTLAALFGQDPFDRGRPLWQFTIVEGLEGGDAALLTKMHHVLSDGIGALRMATAYLDLSPDPDGDNRGRTGDRRYRVNGRPAPQYSQVQGGLSRALGGLVRTVGGTASALAGNLDVATQAMGEVCDALRRPQSLPHQAVEAATMARSLGRQLAVVEPARSPLWSGHHSLAHSFESLTVDLDRTKRAAKSLGGTLNDVFVTAVAGGAGAYHRHRGIDVAELRMTMPVSTRTGRSVGGNAWTPTRLLIPVSGGDATLRFLDIRDRLAAVKGERSLGLTTALTSILRTLPVPLTRLVARQQVGTVDFACSNVRGASFDLWVAGARVVANYPMGPTVGTAFNATVMSYVDRLDLGLNIDAGAVEEPIELRDRISDGFDELFHAAER